MKSKNTILNNMAKDHDIKKYVNGSEYSSFDAIYSSCISYIKAIKQRRMFCVIDSVSSSGMSRIIHFHGFNVNKKQGAIRNYYTLFCALGYNRVKNSNGFRISGCGMDMIFHTNYTNIFHLQHLGFMSKVESDKLAQMTPNYY